MRIKTTWMLALLCILFGTLVSVAQDAEAGSPEDNACNTGGSLEGKCDWPTEAEDEWAWSCGWYIARVDTGEYTINDVPDWCNYYVTPQWDQPQGCYDSTSLSQLDFAFVGPLNTIGNVQGYFSTDGSCSGLPFGMPETAVSTANPSDANDICMMLLGSGYIARPLTSLGYDTPASWYGCSPF